MLDLARTIHFAFYKGLQGWVYFINFVEIFWISLFIMNRLLYAILIMGLLLVGGCGNDEVDRQLDLADSLLDNHPDSALEVIERLDESLLSSRKQRARYGLLRHAALTKIGHEPAADSLLKEAISYYGDDTDPSREKLLTHFFYASVLDIIDDDANALEQYEIAIKTGEELNEYLYTGYSYSNMASMYEEDWIGEEEMKYAEKALEKIRLTNDTTRIIDMLIQYGAVLMHNEKHAEADQIFHEGLQLFDSHLDSALLKRILLFKAYYLASDFKYKEAIEFYLLANSKFPGAFDASDHGMMAEVLIWSGKIEEANKHRDIMKSLMVDMADSMHWYQLGWSLTKHTGKYAQNADLIDSALYSYDKMERQIIKQSLLHKEKYKLTTDKELITQINQQNETIIRWFIIAVLLAAMLLFFGGRRIWIKYRRKLSEQSARIKAQNSSLEKYKEELSEKVSTITILEESREQAENKFKDYSIKSEKEIGKLRKSLLKTFHSYNSLADEILQQDLRKVSKSLREDYTKQRDNIAEEYRSKKTLQRLIQEIDSKMENLYSTICGEISIDDKETRILIYTISGFNYKSVGYLLDQNPKTISSTRSRLINRILRLESPNKELYRRYLLFYVNLKDEESS